VSTTARTPNDNVISSIDHVTMEETVAPQSIAELSDIVRECHAAGRALFPAGGGRSLDAGLPPTRSGVVVDTRGIDGVDDYPAEDMTITVESGIRLADLAVILSENGQMLPIDCADVEHATLGGALATATSGPRRLGYGTPRDYVIGIDTIQADGTRVHGGGRVVKNVAGYDFMKLHTGAHGSLGVIAQVTLKLKPLPENRAAVSCCLAADQMEPMLARLNRSQIRPVGIELLGGSASTLFEPLLGAATTGWRLILLFEETAPANAWQLELCQRELRDAKALDLRTVAAAEYTQLLDQLVDWQANAPGQTIFKANLLPSMVANLCQAATQHFPDVALLAHAGNGIVWGALPEMDYAKVHEGLATLRRLVGSHAGNLTVPRCPPDWKDKLGVWGAPRGDWSIMEKLKRKLDPENILNPGRMFPR
jgi:glycolate oxidase FAD binding subunit